MANRSKRRGEIGPVNPDFSYYPEIGVIVQFYEFIRYLGRTHGNELEGRKTDCFLPDMNRILVAL